MDQTQLILTVALTISTIFLSIIGIQLISILRETRKIIKRVNAIFDSLEKTGLTVKSGFEEIYGFITGFKTILKLLDVFHKKNGKEK